ncbi:hypothetical protein HD554DRAFT_2034459 [Boletus coccyginus]|nr:hypothetical protein HD554DRAFT_2034459 [Boletus coccyginus]
MYELVPNVPLNTNFVPEAENVPAFQTVSITGNQENPPQTYAVIPTEWFDIVPPHVGGLVATGRGSVHESFHGITPPEGFPAVPAPTCGLAGGLHCTLPLGGSDKSIGDHLRVHGHTHPQRQAAQCPWVGCSDTLQWMNIPRHIRSIHLGVRFSIHATQRFSNAYRITGMLRRWTWVAVEDGL